MNKSSLLFEITVILIIKLIILYSIWHTFFNEQHQEHNTDTVAERFLDQHEQQGTQE
tara:strand:+ start:607 stop:777 length:171 start_codon:yes stop_codon:yes gene_type:complete